MRKYSKHKKTDNNKSAMQNNPFNIKEERLNKELKQPLQSKYYQSVNQ